MDATWRAILWQQFGAAIDMLDETLIACPEELWHESLWSSEPEFSQFWYLASHALFWLDFYLSGSAADFAPPAPFGLEELDPAGRLPERPYTKEELRAYLAHCREKCRTTITTMTDKEAQRPCRVSAGQLSLGELLLYTMRHVQEHAAQLSMVLGQQAGWSPGWVVKAKGSGEPHS